MAANELNAELHAALQECMARANAGTLPTDLLVTRLESMIQAIRTFQSQHVDEIPWATTVKNIIQRAVAMLMFAMEPALQRGRPRLRICMQNVEYMLSMNFRVSMIAEMLGVSRATINRRMAEDGISARGSYSQIPHDTFTNMVLEILLNHPNTGYKTMKGHLLAQGVKVTDLAVRQVMREVDPAGVYQRTLRNRVIVRRQYYVQHSNQLWHIDTNMTLVTWNFVVHGCVDGKSRTCIYLDVSSDNRADTNFMAFMQGVQQYGIPLRTRSDKGGENVMIARFMIERRGTGRASHICGKSVHNQRIERFWRDVADSTLSFYYYIFLAMESDNVLNIDNPKHMWLLHYIFLPRIRVHLRSFMHGWNHHPMSTDHNFTPRQLMMMHLPPPEVDMALTEDDIYALHFCCNGNDDLARFDDEESIVNPLMVTALFSDEEKAAIARIDPLQPSENFGYDLFNSALQHLQ